MPHLDSASSRDEAERILRYWAKRIKGIKGTSVAGVKIRQVHKNLWYIELELHVSEDSAAYQNFKNRLGI